MNVLEKISRGKKKKIILIQFCKEKLSEEKRNKMISIKFWKKKIFFLQNSFFFLEKKKNISKFTRAGKFADPCSIVLDVCKRRWDHWRILIHFCLNYWTILFLNCQWWKVEYDGCQWHWRKILLKRNWRHCSRYFFLYRSMSMVANQFSFHRRCKDFQVTNFRNEQRDLEIRGHLIFSHLLIPCSISYCICSVKRIFFSSRRKLKAKKKMREKEKRVNEKVRQN